MYHIAHCEKMTLLKSSPVQVQSSPVQSNLSMDRPIDRPIKSNQIKSNQIKLSFFLHVLNLEGDVRRVKSNQIFFFFFRVMVMILLWFLQIKSNQTQTKQNKTKTKPKTKQIKSNQIKSNQIQKPCLVRQRS